ncbi:unnamed protein product [Victoria cruziana]
MRQSPTTRTFLGPPVDQSPISKYKDARSDSGSTKFGSMVASSVAAQQSLVLPMVDGITRQEPTMDGFAPQFGLSEYPKAASYLRNLMGDVKLGVSPRLDMKLSSLQFMTCTSFGSSAW